MPLSRCARIRFHGAGLTRIAGANAFTLVELLVAVALVTVLVLVGVPAYSEHVERARVSQAIGDILTLSLEIERYQSDNSLLPPDLSAVGGAGKVDPWGRPYRYLNLQLPGNAGNARKNKNLVPINSDFDLYSAGKDGASMPPLTAKPSRDDVVRAYNGRFVDLGLKYH